MNYVAFAFAVFFGLISVLHKTMVSKIHKEDGKVLSTFALPRVIRAEYKTRFGKDILYRSSQLLPAIAFLLVLIASVIVFRR